MPDNVVEIDEYLKNDLRSRSLLGTARGIEGDPKKAADSISIERAGGPDSNVIYNDYDKATKKYQSGQAQDIVEKNKILQQYVDSHPLAATVSKNDWGGLADLADKFSALPAGPFGMPIGMVKRALPYVIESAQAGLKSMYEPVIGEEDQNAQIKDAQAGMKSYLDPELQKQLEQYTRRNPAMTNVIFGAMQVAFSPAIGLLQSEITAPIEEKFSAEEGWQRFLKRDFTEGLATLIMFGLGARSEIKRLGAVEKVKETQQANLKQLISVADEIQTALDRGEVHLKAGEAVPTGLHPAIDMLIAADSEYRLKILDAVTDAADKTGTKEISPEMAQNFNKIAAEGKGINLRWDAVKAVYGDKIPEAGDKLLGDLPGLKDQYERNATLGHGDIELSLGDYVSLDKDVRKLVEKDILFPDGVTRNEMAEMPKATDLKIGRVDEQGVPGLTDEFNRPAKLERTERGSYDIKDEHGDVTSKIKVAEIEGGKTLVVYWEKGDYDVAGMREVLRQLKAEFPEAEAITGPKIPGMDALERGAEGSKVSVDFPFRFKEHPIDIIRRGSGLTPLFDEPRQLPTKLQLIPGRPREVGLLTNWRPVQGKHGFMIADEFGKHVADLEVTPYKGGKEVYIDWIGLPRDNRGMVGGMPGLAGMEGTFGPKLIRGLIRDLRSHYPKVEVIAGQRVSGARGKAAPGEIQVVEIHLKTLMDEIENAPPGWDRVGTDVGKDIGPETRKFLEVIEEMGWKEVQPGTMILPAIKEELAAHQVELFNKINTMLKRIGGRQFESLPVEAIARGARRPSGFYQQFIDRLPLLAWSLNALDPIGTARHEAIHHLRRHGLIRPDEWKVLYDAALTKDPKTGLDWLQKHEIKERYGKNPDYNFDMMVEEAVADEFRMWQRGTKEDRLANPRNKIFQKILDILEGVKDVYHQVMGRVDTEADIFGRIERGATAKRVPTVPKQQGIQPFKPLYEEPRPEAELTRPIEAEGMTFEPGALMPKEMYRQYINSIDAQRAGDAEHMFAEAKDEARKRLTPEWKSNEFKEKTQALGEIGNRPDFLLSAFFRNGKFFGQDIHWLPKWDPKFLTKEQIAALPERFVKAGGLNPDDVATTFGQQTGRELVDLQVGFEESRGKLGPKEFLEKLVKEETARRMEQKYGKLPDVIAREAREHVVSKEQIDILHQEYLRIGTLLDQSLPLSKVDLKFQAETKFNEMIGSKVELIKLMRDLGRSGKAAEKAFFREDYITAFKEKENQVMLMMVAEQVKKFEKQKRQLEKDLYMHRKQVTFGTPNPYSEWIHDIAFRIGRPPLRDIGNLRENIATRPQKTLEAFYNDKNGIGLPEGAMEYEIDYTPSLIIADFLMDPVVDKMGLPGVWEKNLDQLTVGEYKAVADSIRSLVKIGRAEGKALFKGEMEDKNKVISRLVEILATQGVKKQLESGTKPAIWNSVNASLLQVEAWFNELSRGDERGEFLQRFSFEFSRAEGEFHRDIRELSKTLQNIGDKHGVNARYLRQKIDNDVFYEPHGLVKDADGKTVIPQGGKEWMIMRRRNLRGVLLNWGNESNRQRVAEGYHTTVEKIQEWLDKNATKEDWLWARDVGKEIFAEIQKGSDRMTMSMSDVLVELLPLGKIMTKAAGELEEWYYPLVYDRTKGGGPRQTAEQKWPVKVRTAQGWQLKRTGSAGPIDLSIQPLANQIVRRVRDNNFREVVHESSKILLDKGFLGQVRRYQGEHMAALLEPYLRDIAGVQGYVSGAEKGIEAFVDKAKQNTIGVMIGYKISTILKHGLTALAQSWREGGITDPEFYKSVGTLFGSSEHTQRSQFDFMMNGANVGNIKWGGSTELQKRMNYISDRIGITSEVQMGKMTIRQKMLSWGSKPVALADMASSMMVWHAKYSKEFKANIDKGWSIEEAHTDAVTLADYSVRRTHGSTSVTAKPEFMRTTNPWVRSIASLYGFFNHVYNRFYEMSWRSKEFKEHLKAGEIVKARKEGMKIVGDFTFYILIPAMIEKVVADWWLQSEKEEEEQTLLGFAAGGMTHVVAGSVPVLRDMIHSVMTGHDPAVGMMGVPLKTANDLIRSLNKESYDDINGGAVLGNAINLLGVATGIGTDQVGDWAKFVYNMKTGEEQPEDWQDWYRGIRTGKSERRKH